MTAIEQLRADLAAHKAKAAAFAAGAAYEYRASHVAEKAAALAVEGAEITGRIFDALIPADTDPAA